MKPIRATVDQAILSKVDRLFDASPVTIFSELLQNSRRAGATEVEIEIVKLDTGFSAVRYSDNGVGIEDPGVLLNLAGRGWGDDIQEAEDPAGMGFFAMSNFERAHVASCGWEADFYKETFVGVEELRPRHTKDYTRGIRISWQWLSEDTNAAGRTLSGEAWKAAKHCGIAKVRISGDVNYELQSQEFIGADLFCREVPELGVKLAVDSARNYFGAARLQFNFWGVKFTHSLTSAAALAICRDVLVDVRDAKHLKLVLPARNAVKHGPALDALTSAAEALLLEWVAKHEYGEHDYSFAVYDKARSMGIDIGESREYLKGSSIYNKGKPYLLVTGCHSCSFAYLDTHQSEWRAVHPDETKEGYSWYDKIPKVTAAHITIDGVSKADEEVFEYGYSPHGEKKTFYKADEIEIRYTVDGREDVVIQPSTLVAFEDTVSYWGSFSGFVMLKRSATCEDCDDIVDTIFELAFSVSDDGEYDSPDTQKREFCKEACADVAEFIGGKELGLKKMLLEHLGDSPYSLLSSSCKWEASWDGDKINIKNIEII